jgi:hypothetical protein
MRYRWFRNLVLSLGILVMGRAGVIPTPARAADTSPSVFQPYPPVEAPVSSPAPTVVAAAETAESAPVASLDRPVALRDDPPRVDRQVQPTGLFSNRNADTIVYSPSANFLNARPLPMGSSDSSALPTPTPVQATPSPPDVPYSWRQSPPTSMPSPNPSSSLIVPVPGSSSAIASPSVVGEPFGAPSGDACCGGEGCAPNGCGDCGGGCCGWGDCCGGCGNGCCFGNRWFGSAEYLLWFVRGQSAPPLLTSGSIADNPPGALGQPGTSVLYGGNGLTNNPYSGVRLRGGYWFNDCHGWGLDLGGFILGSGVNNYSNSSLGTPFLARPFFNAATGAQDIEAVASPNGLTGTFSARNTFLLFGAEANLRRNLFCGCNWFIDGFAGWRMLGLNESLTMTENLAIVNSTNPSLPIGSTFVVTDRFSTSNLFNGAQIGGIGEYRVGRWYADVRASIALGGTQQVVNIAGSTVSQAPGFAPTTSTGGLLAQTSNIGNYSRGMVSMVDEIGLNIGYQFTNHIRGFVGYNFLYWTSVVRPGNQIDPVVNPNLIPPAVGGGPSRPAFSFNGSDFWAQGINVGLDIRW